MFNRDIDVALIMREIQGKASKKAQTTPDYGAPLDVDDNLADINQEVDRIHCFIENIYDNTKAQEDIAINLPVNSGHSPIMRKLVTFMRRCVRKLARFIIIDQTNVNKSLNSNVHALLEAQQQMKRSFNIINQLSIENMRLSEKLEAAERRLVNIEAKGRKLESKVRNIEGEIGEHVIREDLYLKFEDEFRGSSETIKARLRFYLDKYVINEIRNKEAERIIDIGCGRGEWLELLSENGYLYTGIDMNSSMVDLCKGKGLNATLGEAIAFLKTLEDNSVKIITGFQIIEHIPFYLLEELLHEAYRVLMFHGKVIFETPNAGNVDVGAFNFYTDPTHKKPVHPLYIDFLARAAGFYETEITYHKKDETEIWWASVVSEDETNVMQSPLIRTVADTIKTKFYSSPDYALIATK